MVSPWQAHGGETCLGWSVQKAQMEAWSLCVESCQSPALQ